MVRNVETDGQVIEIAGPQQITQATISPLERQIDEAISAKPEGIDLNLRITEIIDSAGLNWMIEVQARLTSCGIKLRLVEISRIAADIFLATRLDARFVIEAKAEEERNA